MNGRIIPEPTKRAIIVSMGTGTAYVMADNDKAYHIGGTGAGGGTLLGLSNRMLNIEISTILLTWLRMEI